MTSRPAKWCSERLLSPLDDVVLRSLGQHREESAVSGYPDDQVPVLVRVDLGIQQGVAGDHVVLNVVAMVASIAQDLNRLFFRLKQ